MAKNAYIGVGSVARKIKQPYVGIGGVARKVKNGYIGVGGVARQFFQSNVAVSALSVGSSVYMNVNGVSREFLVVHQGIPDADIYDSSCNGTWLLMKDLYDKYGWGANDTGGYHDSYIHSYLNDTYLNMFDDTIINIIKTVKIPYCSGPSCYTNYVKTGEDGLSTKLFLLSWPEVGFGEDFDGRPLSYFTSDSRRIAYADGTATKWMLRTTPSVSGSDGKAVALVDTDGSNTGSMYRPTQRYFRPALILPSTALVDDSLQVIA